MILAIVPPLARMLVLNLEPMFDDWIYRALTFLVISCPCALVISIPLSFFAGIGGSSREGILIKGSNYMETLSKTKYVVFDKTGTLTQGVFEVNGVHHSKLEPQKVIELAAAAECSSSHPISKSLQKAYGKLIDRKRVGNITELSGKGIIAEVDGHNVAVGNAKLMDHVGVVAIPCHQVGTIVHVAIDNEYAGHIIISDIIKPHAKEAVSELKRAGVEKTVMLTGDAKAVANQVASTLGIDDSRALRCCLKAKYKKLKISSVESLKKPNLLLSATESTTLRYCPALISVSLWVQWAPTRQSKLQTSCSWMTIRAKLPKQLKSPANALASYIRISYLPSELRLPA